MEESFDEMHDDVFAEHAEWLFNVFRLVLADRSAAAAMTAGTLADACAAGSVDRVALLDAAVERMEPTLRVPRREAGRLEAVADVPAAPAIDLGAVDDVTLSLYVRSLPFPMRQVVALRTILGVPRPRVAGALGVAETVVDRLEAVGLAALAERLEAHVAERDRRHPPEVPAAALAHLVTERVGAPRHGIVRRFVLALERLAARARAGVGVGSEQGTGPVSRPAPPPPTPTTRPIERPQATPSMRDYQAPSATAGTGVHRRSPTGTPSTQRLSNPRRPGRR